MTVTVALYNTYIHEDTIKPSYQILNTGHVVSSVMKLIQVCTLNHKLEHVECYHLASYGIHVAIASY